MRASAVALDALAVVLESTRWPLRLEVTGADARAAALETAVADALDALGAGA